MAPLSPEQIGVKVQNLRQSYASRDARMRDVRAVRDGEMQSLYPDLWPEAWPHSIIANFVEMAVRDISEVIAPLPSFSCTTATMTSDAARKFADKKAKILHHYLITSGLARQMYDAVDQYLTYGFVPLFVDPDFERQTPIIRTESPLGGYPEFDRFKRLRSYTKVYSKTVRELCLLYPELAHRIKGNPQTFGSFNRGIEGSPGQGAPQLADNAKLDLVRYMDMDQTVLFLPQRNDMPLDVIPNGSGELQVRVAVRPNGTDMEQTGQFDDVIWVQLARAYMASLNLEAMEKVVQAPMIVPSDVQELPYGPDSIIRTDTPGGVARVPLDLPPSVVQQQELLDEEQRTGSRYPNARSGEIGGSIVTGQGVQALLGGFDTQVKTAQAVFKEVLREVLSLCFKLDEYWWPSITRSVRGEHNGTPFNITYRCDKDIKGDHTVNVTYGFLAGLNPNQALVFMLQMRSDRWISRETARRQMPMEINITDEETKVAVELSRDALQQAIAGIAQAVPEMAAQGVSPSQTIQQFTALIKALNDGKSIEQAADAAFPAPPPAPPPDPTQAGAPGGGAPGQSVPGIGPDGRVTGVAPGQAGVGQGGRPQLQALLAGLTSSGQPSLQANLTQRLPVQQ